MQRKIFQSESLEAVMINARDFVDPARDRGFTWYAGVPCSFLTPFINAIIGDAELDYLSSTNEGDAVAAAAGAWIGGTRSIAMMQNSGLGNAVSPLTSLTHTFRIPVLIVCTHRGARGVSDEPQHQLMGAITEQLFETMTIPWATFPRESNAVDPTLDALDRHMKSERRPFALIMQKGTCEPHPLGPAPRSDVLETAVIEGNDHAHPEKERHSRSEVLRVLLDMTGDGNTVIVATTGYTGRELYALADRPNHLYLVGSMGCGSSLGMGLALARPDLRVIVVDGDGAALMRMGNLATAGAYAPRNLVHLLLDNEAHDSTGAQRTVSSRIDFAGIAAACGYRRVVRSDGLDDIERFLDADDGVRFMHFKIKTGAIDPLPRPSISPPAVLERLMEHIGTRT